jgi:hypothetical protein
LSVTRLATVSRSAARSRQSVVSSSTWSGGTERWGRGRGWVGGWGS